MVFSTNQMLQHIYSPFYNSTWPSLISLGPRALLLLSTNGIINENTLSLTANGSLLFGCCLLNNKSIQG